MSGNPAAALNPFAAHHDEFKDVYNLGTDEFDSASVLAELLNGLPSIAFRGEPDRLQVERLRTRLAYVMIVDEADKMNIALQTALFETMLEKGVIPSPNGDSRLVRGVLYLLIAISNVPASSECDLPASVNQEGHRIFEMGHAVIPGPRGARRPCMVLAGVDGNERPKIDISGAMAALYDGSLKPLLHAYMRARDAPRRQSLFNRWDSSTIIPVADTRSEKAKLTHLSAIAIANVLSSFQRAVLADAPKESALRGLASMVAVTVDCTDTFHTSLQEVLTKVQEGHDKGFTGQASSRTEESFILNLAVTLGQQAAMTAIRREGELLQGDDDERLVLWLRALRDSATELLQLSPDAEHHAPARSPLALAPPRLAARAGAPGGRGAAQLAIASEPHVECAALGKARAASAAAVTPRPALLFARGKGPDVEAQAVRVNDAVAMRFLSTGTLNANPREKAVVNAYGYALPVDQLREFAQSKGAPQFLSRYCGAIELAVLPSPSVSTSTLPCEAAVTAPYGASTAPEGTGRPEVVLGVCCAPLGPGQQCPCVTPPVDWLLRYWEASALKLGAYNPQELSNTLYAFGQLSIVPPSDWLERFWHASASVLGGFNSQDFSNTIYACGQLGIVPPADWLERYWHASALKLGEFDPQALSNTLYACGLLHMRPPAGWLQRFSSACEQAVPGMNEQGLANTAVALTMLQLWELPLWRGWLPLTPAQPSLARPSAAALLRRRTMLESRAAPMAMRRSRRPFRRSLRLTPPLKVSFKVDLSLQLDAHKHIGVVEVVSVLTNSQGCDWARLGRTVHYFEPSS